LQQVLLKGRGLMTRYGIKTMKKLLSILLLIAAFIFVGTQLSVNASNLREVTVTAIYDGSTAIIDTDNYELGNKIAMDVSGAPVGQTFAFWVVNGVVQPDLPVGHLFTITTNMNLQAVFTPADKVVALFIDVNGELLGYRYATSGSEVDITGIPVPSRPGYITNTSSDHRFENILNESTVFDLVENSVFVQRYIRDSYDDYEVTVINGTGSDFYLFNTIATVVANPTNEGLAFSHWEENGNRVSYDLEYSFTVLKERTLEAKYVEGINPMPLVSMSEDLALRAGYKSYIGQFYVPEGYELIEYGFLTSDEEKIIKKDMASVTTRQSTNHHAFTNEFVSSFNEVTLVHAVARAYLTVKKDGQLLTVHSNYQAGGSKLFATDLFISEYIEGSSNNKAIEIFNGTGNSVDLSAYKVNLYGNGSATATDSLQLNGILAHGEVYVIYNSGAIQAIKDVGDVSSSVTFYNGDDALALVKNDVVIDAFGIIGSDPGTSWTVGSGATAEFTLVRKVSVTGPTTTWDTNEWDVYPQDTTSYLGDHNNSFGVRVDFKPMIIGYTNKTILIGSTTFDYLDGISAMDDTDSVLNVDVYVENSLEEDVTNVDVSELPVGVYTVEISTTNTLGNATLVTYTLTINTGNAPVIFGTSNINVLIDGVLDLMDGVTATDVEDGVITGSILTSIVDDLEQPIISIDTSVEGTYTVTYSVTDSHGNLTTSVITVTVASESTPVEVQLYSTGFESTEGFIASSTYNNTTINYQGATGQKWGFYYGTPSTTGPITGSQSAQLRFYTANPDRLGYAAMDFNVSNITRVTFKALNTSGNNVKVYYSKDDGVTWVGAEQFTLATTAASFEYVINQTGPIRIKFELVPGTTNGSRVTIDDVVIYGYSE